MQVRPNVLFLSLIPFGMLLFSTPILLAQKEDAKVKDADGNVYQTIQIGKQVWMKENLRTTRFRNGEKIPYMDLKTDWSKFYKQAVSEKPKSNYQKSYGLHYNWYAVADPRQLCPAGYRVPTRQDFLDLLDNTGRNPVKWSDKSIFSQGEPENIGGKLKAVSKYWLPPNTGAGNQSGFTALPAGYRAHGFEDMGMSAWFWTSTEYNQESADGMVLSNESGGARLTYHFKTNGFSVRCIRE
jgi:uncharacterized protein (TIGR02145 family)